MDLIADGGLLATNLPAEPGKDPGAGLGSLLDELAHGILVSRLDGKLLHANQPGRRELARGQVLALRQNQLQAATVQGSAALQEAFARAAHGKRSLIQLDATEGRALSAVALPLGAAGNEPPFAMAILFARELVCDSLMLCFFARQHGLTPTEEQVLGILCQGYSAPEAAAQLNVAVSTVRSHVRSLCAKTGSSGVRELVGRIALLPPVAAPQRHRPLH